MKTKLFVALLAVVFSFTTVNAQGKGPEGRNDKKECKKECKMDKKECKMDKKECKMQDFKDKRGEMRMHPGMRPEMRGKGKEFPGEGREFRGEGRMHQEVKKEEKVIKEIKNDSPDSEMYELGMEDFIKYIQYKS